MIVRLLKLLTLLLFINLVGCATYHNMDTKSNYEYALDAINRGDNDAGYRLLESYYESDKIPNGKKSANKAKADQLFKRKQVLVIAGLNTFSETSFNETLKRHQGNKSRAVKEEVDRLKIFQRISPKLYTKALANFKSYFGNTPEYFIAEDIRKEKARVASIERYSILKERLKNAKVTTKKLKSGATFTNVTFAGSLQPNFNLGCISINEVTNKHNPPALIYAAIKCIKQDKHIQANDLITTGLGFAYYDLKRLADRSARGARNVLVTRAFSGLTEQERKKNIRVGKKMKFNPKKVKAYCTQLKKIGVPSYEPQWAILHGLGVYQEPRNGHYLANVDKNALWQEVLRNRCTPPKNNK